MLCAQGGNITEPRRALPFLQAEFPEEIAPTCEIVEAALHSYNATDEFCATGQRVGALCGCPVPDDACPLCPNGGDVTTPDKELPFLSEQFGGIVPTCGLLEASLLSMSSSEGACGSAQMISAGCGCPGIEEPCMFCPNDDMTKPEKVLMEIQVEAEDFGYDLGGISPTCELVDLMAQQVEGDTMVCSAASSLSYLCGCNGGRRSYFGADTDAKQAVLAWLPRVSAVLSIMGSSFIISDVLRDKNKRSKCYHQLVLCISIFDLFTSFAWAFSTLPIPPTNEYGESTGRYGAKGNDATCTAQGFFIQLGMTASFYNLSLALYYLLVIFFSWKEHQIKNIRVWIYGIPLLVGVVLAFSGIPYYEDSLLMCYLPPPPIAPRLRGLMFFILPILIVLASASVAMFLVYWKVYQQETASNKWRTPGSTGARNNTLSTKVFWQAFWYLAAFYVCWPMLVWSHFARESRYGLFVAVSFMAPLQGALNCCVYLRPRYFGAGKHRRRLSALFGTVTARTSLMLSMPASTGRNKPVSNAVGEEQEQQEEEEDAPPMEEKQGTEQDVTVKMPYGAVRNPDVNMEPPIASSTECATSVTAASGRLLCIEPSALIAL